MDKTYHFCSGNSPLLISMPHVGTGIPEDIKRRLTPEAMNLQDVDWHLPILYDMVKVFDISVISAEYARYVIDLNRSPENTSLYPGQDVTGLCPIDTFAKSAIYMDGKQPDENEIETRIEQYWRPYHQKLATELQRIQAIHGIAILWDAHSIASHVPRFFSGKLPDLNFGTADSSSCDISLQDALAATMRESIHVKAYSHVFNGRFKGGYITRQYGAPKMNIHALQLEMSQCIYMEENLPYKYNAELAMKVKPLLADLLETCLNWAKTHK
ncbi:N-formylglutamate deformylase [Methylotenera versatilis]|uniref:N-formylglutamate amidohydrolase n=1 Tax=Methylotenera versatilis (strain 301) TaxID=666681 RepID=D7DIC0_METV0|nr:N-formylglutamate deformylase [Methylotenera versatilis]ADI29805.1 N-formylglutamate amidohydrolase [Methylotenera versatilis 301]